MNQESGKQKSRKPMGKGKSILVNLLVTLVVGLVYFYFTIPAINPQSADFYSFLFLLCVVYMVSALVTSGFRGGQYGKPRVGDYFRFIKQQCLPVGVFMLLVVAVALVGQLLSLPIFRAGSYRELLTVEDGTFSEDISQISFDQIPTLDRASAEYLGDRQMGTLSDMVSQFEYPADQSVQINYQGRPVRVCPHRLRRPHQVVHQPERGPARLRGGGYGDPGGQRGAAPGGDEVFLLRAFEPQHHAPPALPVPHLSLLHPPL